MTIQKPTEKKTCLRDNCHGRHVSSFCFTAEAGKFALEPSARCRLRHEIMVPGSESFSTDGDRERSAVGGMCFHKSLRLLYESVKSRLTLPIAL
jgi:hypothetical protein